MQALIRYIAENPDRYLLRMESMSFLMIIRKSDNAYINVYGDYKDSLRLCFLPQDENTKCGYWFGFESEIQKTTPVFKARTSG